MQLLIHNGTKNLYIKISHFIFNMYNLLSDLNQILKCGARKPNYELFKVVELLRKFLYWIRLNIYYFSNKIIDGVERICLNYNSFDLRKIVKFQEKSMHEISVGMPWYDSVKILNYRRIRESIF